jgi:parvulin-like peptidyl-prolyl isomerase
MQKLVNQELHRRGIDVSASEIRQAARYAPPAEFMDNPMFRNQQTGQFDINRYHQFLSSPAVDNQLLMQLEAYYRDVIPRSKLFYQVTAGTYMPESQMWRIWADGKETAKARFVVIDPNVMVPDASVSVSDKEIDQYYKSHQDEFKMPAMAKVQYVSIDRSPTASDSAAALQRAQQVRTAALADFAGTAKRESADSVSGKNGGSLGKMRRGQTVPAFEQAAFAIPVGQVSEPVLTQFGYHIIKVSSRTNDEADVSHILIPITRSQENEDRLLDRADSLETLGQDLPLQQVAARMGLRIRDGELNDSTPFLPGVGAADDAAQWIFKDGQPGEISEVFETPQVYYMVELVSKRESGVASLDATTPMIRQKLIAQKKIEKAKESARNIVDKIRAGTPLDQAAVQAKLQVQSAGPFTRIEFVPGLGRANAAVGTAFGLKPGQVSDVVESDGLLYIIQTVERTQADRKQFDQEKSQNRARLTQALAEQRWNEFLAALKETAKIVDNRAALQKQAAQQPPAQS